MKSFSVGLLSFSSVLCSKSTTAFVTTLHPKIFQPFASCELCSQPNDESEVQQQCTPLDSNTAKQFKIITCSLTACAKRTSSFGLDEYALYSGIYERKEDNLAPDVQIEEGPCMGKCQFGPCIGVEHEDYEGFVGLEGMKGDEIASRVFQT